MAKKIVGYIKLQVPAGSANPSPPIGPALGQRGLNIMEFCKTFNAKTQQMEKGMPIPVNITVFSDKSFAFEMKTPPASYFLKKAAKLASGSKAPGRTFAGTVTKAQVRDSEEAKMKDLNANAVDTAMRLIEGSGRSRWSGRFGRAGAKGRDQFRSLHRHAGHDGYGRASRQSARSARHDAEPEGWHCHHGCDAGDQGRQRRRGGIPR